MISDRYAFEGSIPGHGKDLKKGSCFSFPLPFSSLIVEAMTCLVRCVGHVTWRVLFAE